MAAITVPELVKEVGIAEEELEVKCSQEHLLSVSSFLDWRQAALYLGLSKIEISDIEIDGRKEQEKRIKALEVWSGKYGFTATYRKLVDALLASGEANDAEKVCRLLVEAKKVLEQDTRKAEQQTKALEQQTKALEQQTKALEQKVQVTTEQLGALKVEKKDLLATLDQRDAQLRYERERVKQLLEGQEKEAVKAKPQERDREPLGAASTGQAVGRAVGAVTGAVSEVYEVIGGKDYWLKLLLIGEVGSGKTSFINLLCNCALIQALGYKFDEDGLARFHQFNDIKLENAQSHHMESKTSGAKLYEVGLGELKAVGIIDTPGFGDSRGMEQDKKNTGLIIDALRGEEYVNCVCLVIDGRQSRMSTTLQYILSEITAILPREVLNNVIVVFTNTADPLDLNFDPNTLKCFFGQRIRSDCIFYIENPYCRFEKAKKKQGQLPMHLIAKSLKKSFEETAQVLGEMCTVMKDLKMVHTHRFVVLYEKKQEIEKVVLTLLTVYDNLDKSTQKMTRIKAVGTQRSESERKRLSMKLLLLIEEFQLLAINRNYAKLLKNQLAVIELHLAGTVGPESQHLRETKDELEEKLQLVQATLNEPFSSSNMSWACQLLGLNPGARITEDKVAKAFREMSIKEHPDKGGDTAFFQRIQRAREILMAAIK